MKTPDDLHLQAYVDGELSPDQQSELLDAMAHDIDLAKRACELRNLKQQVRLAYTGLADRPPQGDGGRPVSWRSLAAGLCLLALGAIAGWSVHPVPTPERPDRLVAPATAPDPVGGREVRIVFHLNDADQAGAGDLLDEVERVLQAFAAEGRPLRIEIVGNGDGMALLRAGLSQHSARISALSNRYPNLAFVACLNTVERLRREEGTAIPLLPEAELTQSGVNHVVKRQRQGWAYIRV